MTVRLIKSALRTCVRVFIRLRNWRGRISPSQCSKFLFLQYEVPLGSAIMVTPVFEALKRTIPAAHIVVACGKTAWQVLKDNPFIDELILTRDPVSNFWHAVWDFIRLVLPRVRRVECAITDAWNRRSRIAFLSMLSPAKIRLGFTLVKGLYDIPLDYDEQTGMLANNMGIVEALGHSCESIEPAIYFSAKDRDAATEFLRQAGYENATCLVAITSQTSGGHPEKRRWRAEWFAAVADHLVELPGYRVVFLGTERERPAIDNIRSLMKGPSESAAGRFAVSELAAFLAQCDLLLTLDTGTLHVGRAVGVPAVVIARPWQPPQEWLPPSTLDLYRVLMKSDIVDECRRNPNFSAPYEIDEINVSEVLDAIDDQLRRFPPTAESRSGRLTARMAPTLLGRYTYMD